MRSCPPRFTAGASTLQVINLCLRLTFSWVTNGLAIGHFSQRQPWSWPIFASKLRGRFRWQALGQHTSAGRSKNNTAPFFDSSKKQILWFSQNESLHSLKDPTPEGLHGFQQPANNRSWLMNPGQRQNFRQKWSHFESFRVISIVSLAPNSHLIGCLRGVPWRIGTLRKALKMKVRKNFGSYAFQRVQKHLTSRSKSKRWAKKSMQFSTSQVRMLNVILWQFNV